MPATPPLSLSTLGDRLKGRPVASTSSPETMEELDAEAVSQASLAPPVSASAEDRMKDDSELGPPPGNLSPGQLTTREAGRYEGSYQVHKHSDKEADRDAPPSLFNPYSLFVHPACRTTNDFLDLEGQDGAFPKFESRAVNGQTGTGGRKLTLQSLLSDFSPDKSPTEPLSGPDFFWAKWYPRIPLNRMVVLRRFPYPTFDNLKFETDAGKVTPVAQAITFFGEETGNDLSELTGVKGYMNWKKMEADVHDVEGNEQGADDSPFRNRLGSKGQGKFDLISGLTNPNASDFSGARQKEIEFQKKYNNFDYTNKVLGPVNVVHETHVRDRGIGATMEIDLVFEYQLKSYNSVNPRLALLDILFNMLSLTHNNARFWGGANRYFPNQPQFAFAGNQKEYYAGNYGKYMQSVVKQMGDGLGKGIDMLGNLISSIFSGNFSSLTSMAKSAGGLMMDIQSQKTRPNLLGFHALLTGLPIGEWHLTIGNPYRPIMKIGNLICKGFDFEFSGHLGVDDFPSELKYTIKLETGRPRDKADLESMFTYGEGRSYMPPLGLMDISTASQKQSQNTVGDQQTRQVAHPPYFRSGASADFGRKLVGTVF